MFWARVGGQDADTGMGFDFLQKVTGFDVGVAVVGILDLGPLAEQGIRFVKEQHDIRPGGVVKNALEIFSVSPMYLLTTVARSIRYNASPSSLATTPAARVLPVPDGPTKSALSPGCWPNNRSILQLRSTCCWWPARRISSSSRVLLALGSTSWSQLCPAAIRCAPPRMDSQRRFCAVFSGRLPRNAGQSADDHAPADLTDSPGCQSVAQCQLGK